MQKLNKSIYEGYRQYPEKILQFGEGNFLRAFVDWQVEKLNQEAGFQGSVVAVQPRGSKKIKTLNEQDGLYTLFLQGMKNGHPKSEHMIISSISRGIDLFSDYQSFKKLAAEEELRFIVSNTTEAGIMFNEEDRLDDKPQQTFPGKLTAFLYFRYQAFTGNSTKGCMIIPCELIEENGRKLKEIVLKYAALWQLGEGFTNWIHHANTFCNSLVDRIVPGFPVDTIDEITAALGYQDNLVVVGEQYHLWVIEGPDDLKDELPFAQARLNTLIVDDLAPYRTKKVRMLNGAHTAMTPVSYLYGLDTVGETIEHEVTGRFVRELIFEEIIPTLDMEGLTEYAEEVLDRFKNPFMKHYLHSIALNSVSKFTTRNLPTLAVYVRQKGHLPERLVFALSALLYYYRGIRDGETIELQDSPNILSFFEKVWSGPDKDMYTIASTALGEQQLWGSNLNEIPGLTKRTAFFLGMIHERGMKQALEECCIKEVK
ncbi:tagaturonate reductase [Bacillus atrophaeus]|uniref:tagaturonate reductase n=1 Tax=Bacillus atrophaeus TaxID=1452 RepID=UPI00077AD16E|nr:tagaturonate reductase [Bacillus atrophaeus]KXZ14093.1 altronate oxidoreductase [Bacillus atrophaeus]MED4809273.1 tagaturonate reductase [Bacillus atrophaeus]GED03858.1 altronate oxidoreductase [Bacillus atrophaeus]